MKSLVEFINEARGGAWITGTLDAKEISKVDPSGFRYPAHELKSRIKGTDKEGLRYNDLDIKVAREKTKYSFSTLPDNSNFDETAKIKIENCGANKDAKYCFGIQTDGLDYLVYGQLTNTDGTLEGEVKLVQNVGMIALKIFCDDLKNLSIV